MTAQRNLYFQTPARNTAMHCPPLEDLRGYAQGAIPEDSAGMVADHLSDCPSCRDQLVRLEQESNWLRDLLRAAPPVDFSSEPELQRVVQGSAGLLAAGKESRGARSEKTMPRGNLGPYRLLAKLGEGGMGAVYKATHEKLRRTVAIKVLPSHALRDADAVARFEREMAAIGSLDSPHIVRAYDAGQVGDEHFLAMEYVDGLNVAQLLQRLGPLSPANAAEIVRQAAIGLQYAHERGLVHRDLKPSNLMVTQNGQVKILDLGLARLINDADLPELTSSQQTMGTPDYLAPEQINGSHDVDIRADLYSLGCTLFALLVGRPPFADQEHKTTVRKLFAHVHESPPQLSALLPAVPRELATVVHRLLAKQPSDRFADPQSLANALAPLAQGQQLAVAMQAALAAEPKDAAAAAQDTSNVRQTGSTGPTGSFQFSVKPKPVRPRPHRRWLVGTAAALLLFAGTILAGVIYVVTGQGTLKIETVDDSVQVIVSKDGAEVEVIDLKEKKSIKLYSGVYRLKLTRGKPGLQLESDAVRLVRGKETVATITRVPGPVAKAIAADDASPKLSNVADGNHAPPTPTADKQEVDGYVLTTILGPFPEFTGDGTWCSPSDINEKGAVIGTCSNSQTSRGFVLANSRIELLNTPRDQHPFPVRINAQGEIVGYLVTKTMPAIFTPFRFEGGNLQTLVPKDVQAVVFDANQEGIVVGYLKREGKGDVPVTIENGQAKELPVPADTTTAWAIAINARRQIACNFVAPRNAKSAWRPYLVNQDMILELNLVPGYDMALASDLNEAGAVVGFLRATNSGPDRMRPFLYENGKMAELPLLPGFTDAHPVRINDSGQIIGRAFNLGTYKNNACLWHQGKVYDIHPKGWITSEATAINDRGQIIGRGGRAGITANIGFKLDPIGNQPAIATEQPQVNRQLSTELITRVEELRAGTPSKAAVKQLRDDLLAMQHQFPGMPVAIEAAVQLSRLPWAADELLPNEIPARELEQLPKQDPALLGSGQIVAVLGTESYASWNKIGSFAFASDGETFATGGRDMLAHIRKLGQKEPLHELVGHARWLFDVSFSPDRSKLVTTSDSYENPRAWDAKTGEPLVRFAKGSNVGRISPDGQTVATGCGLNATASHPSGNIEIGRFDGQPGQSLPMSSNYIHALAWSPDGKQLVAGSGQIIKLWDWQRGNELRVIADLDWSNQGQWNYALALAFDPRGANFALAGNGHHILIWNARDGKQPVRTVRGHRAPVFSVDYSPDGRLLASAALDCSVRIWDAKDDRQLHAFQLADGPLVEGQQVYFPRVQFLPDSRHVAASVGTGKIFILRLAEHGLKIPSQQ